MIEVALSFIGGHRTSIATDSDSTLKDVLCKTGLVNFPQTPRFFFSGREIPLESTLRGAGVRNGSNIVCLVKRNVGISGRAFHFDSKKMSKQNCVHHAFDLKENIAHKESSRIIDRCYRTLELNPKQNILFKSAISRMNNMNGQGKREEIIKTNLDYETKMSTEPLPLDTRQKIEKVAGSEANSEQYPVSEKIPLTKRSNGSFGI